MKTRKNAVVKDVLKQYNEYSKIKIAVIIGPEGELIFQKWSICKKMEQKL